MSVYVFHTVESYFTCDFFFVVGCYCKQCTVLRTMGRCLTHMAAHLRHLREHGIRWTSQWSTICYVLLRSAFPRIWIFEYPSLLEGISSSGSIILQQKLLLSTEARTIMRLWCAVDVMCCEYETWFDIPMNETRASGKKICQVVESHATSCWCQGKYSSPQHKDNDGRRYESRGIGRNWRYWQCGVHFDLVNRVRVCPGSS